MMNTALCGTHHCCCRAGTLKSWSGHISRWEPDSGMHWLGSEAGKLAESYMDAGCERTECNHCDSSALNWVQSVWDGTLNWSVFGHLSTPPHRHDPSTPLDLWNTRGLAMILASIGMNISMGLSAYHSYPYLSNNHKHQLLPILVADTDWKL